jgi:hypothetical protein
MGLGVTIPISALLAALIYYILKHIHISLYFIKSQKPLLNRVAFLTKYSSFYRLVLKMITSQLLLLVWN